MNDNHGTSINRRRLGRTGLVVPALALGGAGIGRVYGEVSDDAAIDTVHYAFSRGIDYIDTAAGYGDSERRIGLALEGVPRGSYKLSTKTGSHPEHRGDYSWDTTMWSVENSLRLLKTDNIDLLLVHDPSDIEPVFAPRGALEALESLKAQGVVNAIGLGQRRHDFHRRAIESGRFDVILTYNDYHPVRTTAVDLLQLAARHDVGVLNGAPLGHGLLAGASAAHLDTSHWASFPARDRAAARRLYEWCAARGVPVQAVAFQYCLRQPLIHCTLSGAKTRSEFAANLEAATMPLPDGIWAELEDLQLTAGQE
jgi:aryl-alcohol dehydrogenase-like predicted oxidoreductase